MTISQYRRWYQIIHCKLCVLSDLEIQGLFYKLVNEKKSYG